MKIFTFLIALIIFSILTIPPESQAKTINKAQIIQTQAGIDLAALPGTGPIIQTNYQFISTSPPIVTLKSTRNIYQNKKKYGFRVSNKSFRPPEVLKE